MNSTRISQCKQLVLDWYDAAVQNYDTTKRIKLYKESNEVSRSIRTCEDSRIKKSLCKDVQQIFIEKQKENEMLSQWIASNTLVVEKKYIGAYNVFHDLFLAVYDPMTNLHFEMNGLQTVDSSSLSHIKNDATVMTMGKDLEGYFIPFLRNDELRTMSVTCSHYREICKELIIKRLNRGEISLLEIGFKSLQKLDDFFGDLRFSLTRLDLSKYHKLKKGDIQNLSEYFPNIESLSLHFAEIEDLSCLANWEMKIKTLELAYCSDLKKFDASFNFSLLTSLNLNGCRQLEIIILEKCCSLESLSVLGCTGVQNIATNCCHHLKHLNLEGCSQVVDLSGIGIYKNLVHLNLGKFNIRDLEFLESLSFLTYLNLDNCTLMDSTIFGKCPSLRTLDFQKAPQDISFLKNFPSITNINLDYSRKIEDLNVLEKCPLLTDLSLRQCVSVNDFEFLGNCPSLTNLDLTGCNVVLDKNSKWNGLYSPNTLDLYALANPPPLQKLIVTQPKMIGKCTLEELEKRKVQVKYYSYI